ncbi:hypothetical protein GCM10023317_59450 [Actinopolymorpha pittospori]
MWGQSSSVAVLIRIAREYFLRTTTRSEGNDASRAAVSKIGDADPILIRGSHTGFSRDRKPGSVRRSSW